MLTRGSLRVLSAIAMLQANRKRKTSLTDNSKPNTKNAPYSTFLSYSTSFNRLEYLILGALAAISILCILETFTHSSSSKPVSTPHLFYNPTAAIKPTRDSPIQKSPHAYATLCVGNDFVIGTIVLFHSIKKTQSKKDKTIPPDFVAMIYNMSPENERLLNFFGIRTYPVTPLNIVTYQGRNLNNNDDDEDPDPEIVLSEKEKKAEQKAKNMGDRDSILWSKLRVWQLEDYTKVVMLDTDLFIIKNPQELFSLPEFAASSAVDKREKIQFWRSADMGTKIRNTLRNKFVGEMVDLLPHWSGLNSGVSVVTPSNLTFTSMLNEISILPNRPCCPSQEFLYFYFSEVNKLLGFLYLFLLFLAKQILSYSSSVQ